MKEQIRQRALELGFDDCRFTSAHAPESAKQFKQWLAEKKFGEMNWIERNGEKRISPEKVLPNIKSVICLAASYENSEFKIQNAGVIARYARFDDYHDVLGERLKALAESVNQLGEKIRCLWY